MNLFMSDAMFNFVRQSEVNKDNLMYEVENRVRHGDSPRYALQKSMDMLKLHSHDFSDSDWADIQREVENLYNMFTV